VRSADSCRSLEWDTRFFGFAVARIDGEVRDAGRLERALAALRGLRVRLAYWMPEDGAAQRRSARRTGGCIAGTRVRYERALAAADAAALPAGCSIERCAALTPELEALGVAAGERSRYATDPGMPPGTAARMYAIWIRESFGGTMGDEVLALRDASGFAGLVTLKFDPDAGAIGLLSVAQRSRGAGIGRALVAAAGARFRERGLGRAHVVTQGENEAACRMYEACGYRRARTQLAAHFWL